MIRLVTDYLDEAADKFPDKIAFADANKQLTFRELRESALNVACELRRRGLFKSPVAVRMAKSVDCITAFMGIVYSGCFYCPIDINMPLARVGKIFDKLHPVLMINDEVGGTIIDDAVEITGFSDLCKESADFENIKETRGKLIDTDILYVMFTSGSTGLPKGVVINHRAVIDYTEWVARKFNVDHTWVFGNQAPFYFDNSILDIYQTLRNGATTYLIPEINFTFPMNMMKYLDQRRINAIFWVPSALCNLANAGVLGKSHCDSLQRVLFCGEVMPTKQLNIWIKEYPDVTYANLYGPTEITDVCSAYVVDREFSDDEPLPIGSACENTDIIVLNEYDEAASEHETGELCVRGTCLFMGYYNDPEKTREVLVQNPLNHDYVELIYRTGDLVHYNNNHELIFDGRKDYQIKHRGHRIELGEIETAVSSLEEVSVCCCIYDMETQQIVLFYTGERNQDTIKCGLELLIPKYMIPGRIIKLENMPYNANGKIDRVELKKRI